MLRTLLQLRRMNDVEHYSSSRIESIKMAPCISKLQLPRKRSRLIDENYNGPQIKWMAPLWWLISTINALKHWMQPTLSFSNAGNMDKALPVESIVLKQLHLLLPDGQTVNHFHCDPVLLVGVGFDPSLVCWLPRNQSWSIQISVRPLHSTFHQPSLDLWCRQSSSASMVCCWWR